MFNKYYQDELVYLRDMGRDFAASHPEAARFLAEAGSDPDVERLLEGFAFLTARLRQKLDDELPEITHAFTEMFWPHYLRPVPSATVLQFSHANPAMAELKPLARGIEVDSVPVDGTRCRFRTCYDTELMPLELATVELRREIPPRLRLKFDCKAKPPLSMLGIKTLSLHLAGEPAVTRALYAALLRHTRRITVRRGDGTDKGNFELPPSALRGVGFRENEALLAGPGPSFPGFRLAQEYFCAPWKFMFVELTGLEKLAGFEADRGFVLDIEFARLPEPMPPVSKANLLLNCTPAVNLFAHDSDPIRLDRARSEYVLRAAGNDPRHYEVFSVDRVYGLELGSAKEVDYLPQYRLARSGKRTDAYYQVRRFTSPVHDGMGAAISFIDPENPELRPRVDTISVNMTCTNGQLPTRLDVGDVSVKTQTTPGYAACRNIMKPTASILPPLDSDLHWRLIAHLNLNFTSLLSVEALRGAISLYNLRANIDRQSEAAHARLVEGIVAVKGKPATRLFGGSAVRGLEIELSMNEELVGGEGETFLFASVLNEFFAQYVSLNAFSHLKVKGTKFGEEFTWPARIGNRAIL